MGGADRAARAKEYLLTGELLTATRAAGALMEGGIAYESRSVRSADHREGVAALKEKRAPKFGGA